MSSGISQRTERDSVATCGLCGKMLSQGYYFVCHVCGATYCYSHMPEKCDHRRLKSLATLDRLSLKE